MCDDLSTFPIRDYLVWKFKKGIVFVVGNVEMWTSKMCTLTGQPCVQMARSSPGLYTVVEPDYVAERRLPPIWAGFPRFHSNPHGQEVSRGHGCSHSSTLLRSADNLWMKGGVLHSRGRPAERGHVIQVLSRSFPRVIHKRRGVEKIAASPVARGRCRARGRGRHSCLPLACASCDTERLCSGGCVKGGGAATFYIASRWSSVYKCPQSRADLYCF